MCHTIPCIWYIYIYIHFSDRLKTLHGYLCCKMHLYHTFSLLLTIKPAVRFLNPCHKIYRRSCYYKPHVKFRIITNSFCANVQCYQIILIHIKCSINNDNLLASQVTGRIATAAQLVLTQSIIPLNQITLSTRRFTFPMIVAVRGSYPD